MKNWAAHKWQNTNTFLMNIEIAIMRETIMHRNSPFIPCFFQVVIFMQRKSEKWSLHRAYVYEAYSWHCNIPNNSNTTNPISK